MVADPFAPLLGTVYGSWYFGVVMGTAFYGVTCMQTFLYYVNYQNDALWMKIFVAILWAINTIHEALIVAGSYKYFLAGWLNISSIVIPVPELVLLVASLVAVPTQGYFVHRLYIFSGKNVIVPFIWVILGAIQIVCPLIYVIRALYSADGVHVVSILELSSPSFSIPATLCVAASAAVDILIAIFLTFLLVRSQYDTRVVSTVNTLQRLTVFAVNTGVWPAMFALLTVALVNVVSLNMLYVAFGVPLCSVYCNTLLANLNARSYILGDQMTYNPNGDLVISSGPPVFNSNKVGEEQEVTQTSPSGLQEIWTTTDVARFPDVDRSIAFQNV